MGASRSSLVSEPIMLVNGFGRCAGRVEIFHHNRSRHVCDANWDSRGGEVVCKQLGCGAVLSAPGNGAFGFGTSEYWLNDINCNGTESKLSDCLARPWGQHNCTPSESASVVCSGDLPKPNFSISANSAGHFNLMCTLPPLHKNTIVYFYEMGKSDPIGIVPLPAEERVAEDTITGAEASTQAEYWCQYKVKAARRLQFFTSPQSDTARVDRASPSQSPLIPMTSDMTSDGTPTTGLNVTAVAASSVVCLVVLAVLVAAVIFVCRRRRSADRHVKKAETATGNINIDHVIGENKGELKRPKRETTEMIKGSPSIAADYENRNVLGADHGPRMPNVYGKINFLNQNSGSPRPGQLNGHQSHTHGDSVRYETMVGGKQAFHPDSSKAEPSIYQELCKATTGNDVYETLNVDLV